MTMYFLMMCAILAGFLFRVKTVSARTAPDAPLPAAPGTPDQPAVPEMLHDIRPPEPAGFDPAIFWWILAAVLVVLLLLVFLYLWKRRKRPMRHTLTPSLPPETTALKSLDELADVERIEGKIFYFRLSAILRNYLRGRYGINAPEMTTEELIPKLERLHTDQDLVQELKNFFRTADPVKYADTPPVQRKMREDLGFARKFVNATTPVEPAEETAVRTG